MTSRLQRALEIFDRVLDTLATLAFMGMMLVLCLQIFFRYVLESPLLWATPMSMFLFIWGIWLGGAAAIRDNNQIRVELAEQFLPLFVRRILMPVITVVCIAFLVLMIVKSFSIIEMQSTTIYDTLPFNRDVLFIVVPIVGSVMIVQCLRVLCRQLQLFYFSDNKQTVQ